MPVRRAVCLCVVGLDSANAREGNSHSFIETTRLMSSVSFPLWPGLSEPSQAHRPLGSLTGNGFELLRGSDTLPGGRGGAVGHWLVTPGVVRGWLPGKKGGEGGSSPWTGDPWVAHGGQGSSRQSECPMRLRPGSRPLNFFSLLFASTASSQAGRRLCCSTGVAELSVPGKPSFRQLLLGTAAVMGVQGTRRVCDL